MSVSKTLYQLQKICSEHSDITFIKIDQHLEKLWKENKGVLADVKEHSAYNA